MSTMAKIALMFVVFIDILGQGLVFPILNSLIMDTNSDLLASSVSTGTRHVWYGTVIGAFFLSWFLGVVYVARVSDSIGRKNALLVCLGGALAGYVITIIALWVNSILLLILGRAITGFTAGNQPIAQAAMVDGSTTDAERDRNMGYIITGVSFGLVGGPILGALLSDKALLGSLGTESTPFYGAAVLVVISIFLVLFYFHDIRTERTRFVFRPLDIIDSFAKIPKHPAVMELMPVYVLFMLSNVTFYVFLPNYLTSAFGYGVVGGSAAMLVVGIALASSSTFLVDPVQRRFKKRHFIAATLAVWTVCALAFVWIPIGPLTMVPVFLFYLFFGFTYPTILGLFSSTVEAEDQGWVMGVTTAVFCLAGGIMSLVGGGLMTWDIRLPYYISAAAAFLGLIAVFATLHGKAIAAAMDGKTEEPAEPESY